MVFTAVKLEDRGALSLWELLYALFQALCSTDEETEAQTGGWLPQAQQRVGSLAAPLRTQEEP